MIFIKIIYASLAAMVLAWLAYWYNFGYLHAYEVSSSPEDWGVLGDFLGGVLNPFLSFLTIVLLVKSLKLQDDSNSQMKSEMERSAHFEKVRSFESQLFNMIESQKVIFGGFRLEFNCSSGVEVKQSSLAVIELESIMAEMKRVGGTPRQIKDAIEILDQGDDIYTVIRTFCVVVKSIDRKLSDAEGFGSRDRIDYYETLINFTDYSLFRLVLICAKYLDYPALHVLMRPEFGVALKNVGADVYLNEV